MLSEQEKYVPPINDIECREPIIIEKKVQEERARENVVLSVKGILRQSRPLIESLAVAAIFTTLGLLIWTVCYERRRCSTL